MDKKLAKSKVISVRVSESEHKKLCVLAFKKRRKLSDFMRLISLGEIDGE